MVIILLNKKKKLLLPCNMLQINSETRIGLQVRLSVYPPQHYASLNLRKALTNLNK